jgi:Sulfotransferase family
MTREDKPDRARRAGRRRKSALKKLRRPWLMFRHRMRRPLLEDAARASTGLGDFGDDYYAEGLEVLLESLREAELTYFGRMMTQRGILLALKQRLLIQDLRRRDPAFFERELLPPIVVTGLPRTGTTLLHRLLAANQSLRAPVLSELLAPIDTRSRMGARLHRLRLDIELMTLRRFTGNLDTMHVSRPDTPEECMFAMTLSFRTAMFWTLVPCYAHMDWYGRSARERKYAEYRDVLSILQSRAPNRPLVLKAPEHLGSVDELLKNVPDALVVVCHRPVSEAITSFNSLIRAMHSVGSSATDPIRIGETNLRFFEAEARRYLAAREHWRHRIMEIDYQELVANPLAVVRAISERAGLVHAPETEDKLRAYLSSNPKGKFGVHAYAASDFGQTADEIAGRLADYRMMTS